MPYFFTVHTDSNTPIDRLIKNCEQLAKNIQLYTSVFILAQRVKKKVKGLFQQLVIHLARILGEPVVGRPPDHQDDPDQDRSHWWGEIKNFIKQIQAEKLSEAQLRKILEDAFSAEEIDAVIEALNKASELMGDSTPTLFQ